MKTDNKPRQQSTVRQAREAMPVPKGAKISTDQKPPAPFCWPEKTGPSLLPAQGWRGYRARTMRQELPPETLSLPPQAASAGKQRIELLDRPCGQEKVCSRPQDAVAGRWKYRPAWAHDGP